MAELNDVKELGAESSTDVLIVGAGPTGLALACDLARRGVRHRLVEQHDGLFPGSRGKGIQPRTLEVFDDLGLVDAVLEAGGPYPQMLPWDGATRREPFDLVEQSGPRPGVPYPAGLMLPQWRTQELLLARLRELGGDAEFGTRLTGLTQDADHATAELTTAAGPSAVRARYAVGTDGGRSAVRGSLGIPMEGETVDPRPMLVADIRLTGLDRDHWHAWPAAEGGGVVLCPLRGTDHFQVIAQYEDTGRRPDTSAEGIRALIGERTVLSETDVQEVLWASDFRARTALAERFRDERVLLAGDAAHLHSPAGGQGLNTSVQDAYNLGWKLGQVLRHGAGEALLDSYEAERLPLAADVLGLSTRMHHAMYESGARPQRGQDTQQLGIGHRDGPLTHELRTRPSGSLRAGDRAPDGECAAPDGSPFRLFDAFRGPHFTLLSFGGAPLPGAVPAGVRAYGVAGAEQHTEDAYGSGLFLVRPDGCIAVAADSAGELTALYRQYGLRLP